MPELPEVPHPSCDVETVQSFLIQYFLAMDPKQDEVEATAKAKKTVADGACLYEISEKDWKLKYGVQGRLIHDDLQRSRYGYNWFFGSLTPSVTRFCSRLGSPLEEKMPQSLSLIPLQSQSASLISSMEANPSSVEVVPQKDSRYDLQVLRERHGYSDPER